MKEKILRKGNSWLKKEMRPYRASIFLLTAFSVLTTVLSLSFAYIVKFLIDSATNAQETLLWIFFAVLLGVLLIRIVLQTVSRYQAEKVRSQMVAHFRNKTFSKLLRTKYANLQAFHSGELSTRLTTDINEVVADTVGLTPAVVGMLVQCIGAIIALLTINPLFTVVYVVCGAIFGGIIALFRKGLKRRHKEVVEADGKARSFMQESLSSTMTIKAYNAEEKTSEKNQNNLLFYYKKRMKHNVLRSSMSGIFTLLSNFGLIFAVVWCSVTILNGNREYGSVLSIILLLMQLQHPFSAFSSILPAYSAREASAERLQELDNLPIEELQTDEDIQITYEKMDGILFDDVTFSYGRKDVFSYATMQIKKGDIVCLTGLSGVGKSTLFKLLLNVYSPTGGNVWLTNKEEKISLTSSHRNLFAYVPQANFLFSGTIYENLTFFADETAFENTDEKIKFALKTACAEFVWELPKGLQTVLTENGGGLSQGQMQRLALARAILSNRPILLLDEATSALDSETEERLLENLKNLQDKTCIIVTHRPSALKIADSVFNVENGKIN